MDGDAQELRLSGFISRRLFLFYLFNALFFTSDSVITWSPWLPWEFMWVYLLDINIYIYMFLLFCFD